MSCTTTVTPSGHRDLDVSKIDSSREAGPSIDVTLATPSTSPSLSRALTERQGDDRREEHHHHIGHMGTAFEHLADAQARLSTQEPRPSQDHRELRLSFVSSRRRASSNHHTDEKKLTRVDLAEEAGSPIHPIRQGVPEELGNLTKEILFVIACSSGQLFFSFLQGNVNVTQDVFKDALGLQSNQLPWLPSAFLVPLGLSVILAGSLTDLAPPKVAVVSAFAWLLIWNMVGCFSLSPSLSILFFIVRAMQGLAVGVLVSGSMSILGRVYNPGVRKTRVFSAMAAMNPFGFWLGCLQGSALSAHLPWIFGTTAVISGLLLVAAWFGIPDLKPAADAHGAKAPGLRDFDYKGAACAVTGCVCLLFGLTQGSVANWAPYTYCLIIVGLCVLGLFFWVEGRVHRPMIPNRLWRTPGFTPLMGAYFIGFGAWAAWQFYVIQYFLHVEMKSALTTCLYHLPNAIVGVLATFIVSRLLHVVPGHYIYVASMFAFAIGPAMFLLETPQTSYWAIAMPAISLCTFGPDLSFASASIFITSRVPRSSQGSAGSLLITIQNLTSAIFTSVGDAIGSQVNTQPDGDVGLNGLRAIWYLSLAAALVGAILTTVAVRIPKEEEKEHIT